MSTPMTGRADWLKQYLIASSWGAARGLAGLPIEHPFDVVKTRCQATGGQISPLEVTKELWNQGMRNFYSGAVPNGIRVVIKQAYRWPMMLGLPHQYNQHLPKSLIQRYPTLPKGLTGLTIAVFEVGLITPLERLKVHCMTHLEKDKKVYDFFLKNRGKLVREMTRGLNATFARQISSWVSFLVADEKLKQWEKLRTRTNELSFSSLMGVSVIVGTLNTAVNMPWDALKTQMTKVNYISNEGVFKSLKHMHTLYGIKGLYAGWQVRLLQYIVQSTLTVTLLDKLENSWNNQPTHLR